MADNGGNGGGNGGGPGGQDDDIMRDDAAAGEADAHARAGADGDVEVVTKVEAPRNVTIGILARGLTVAQMKDATTAAGLTLEAVMFMAEDVRPTAWTCAYTAATGSEFHGFVVVDVSPAPRSLLETRALEGFYEVALTLDGMSYAVTPSAEFNPVLLICELYTVLASGMVAYVSDGSLYGSKYAGKAVLAVRDTSEEYIFAYRHYRATEEGAANKPRRIALYEQVGQGAANPVLKFAVLAGSNAVPGLIKLPFQPLTLTVPIKFYLAGVDQAFIESGVNSAGCRAVAQHFGAVYCDTPRSLRSADHRGQAWVLYFKAAEQMAGEVAIATAVAATQAGRLTHLTCGNFEATLRVFSRADEMAKAMGAGGRTAGATGGSVGDAVEKFAELAFAQQERMSEQLAATTAAQAAQTAALGENIERVARDASEMWEEVSHEMQQTAAATDAALQQNAAATDAAVQRSVDATSNLGQRLAAVAERQAQLDGNLAAAVAATAALHNEIRCALPGGAPPMIAAGPGAFLTGESPRVVEAARVAAAVENWRMQREADEAASAAGGGDGGGGSGGGGTLSEADAAAAAAAAAGVDGDDMDDGQHGRPKRRLEDGEIDEASAEAAAALAAAGALEPPDGSTLWFATPGVKPPGLPPRVTSGASEPLARPLSPSADHSILGLARGGVDGDRVGVDEAPRARCGMVGRARSGTSLPVAPSVLLSVVGLLAVVVLGAVGARAAAWSLPPPRAEAVNCLGVLLLTRAVPPDARYAPDSPKPPSLSYAVALRSTRPSLPLHPPAVVDALRWCPPSWTLPTVGSIGPRPVGQLCVGALSWLAQHRVSAAASYHTLGDFWPTSVGYHGVGTRLGAKRGCSASPACASASASVGKDRGFVDTAVRRAPIGECPSRSLVCARSGSGGWRFATRCHRRGLQSCCWWFVARSCDWLNGRAASQGRACFRCVAWRRGLRPRLGSHFTTGRACFQSADAHRARHEASLVRTRVGQRAPNARSRAASASARADARVFAPVSRFGARHALSTKHGGVLRSRTDPAVMGTAHLRPARLRLARGECDDHSRLFSGAGGAGRLAIGGGRAAASNFGCFHRWQLPDTLSGRRRGGRGSISRCGGHWHNHGPITRCLVAAREAHTVAACALPCHRGQHSGRVHASSGTCGATLAVLAAAAAALLLSVQRRARLVHGRGPSHGRRRNTRARGGIQPAAAGGAACHAAVHCGVQQRRSGGLTVPRRGGLRVLDATVHHTVPCSAAWPAHALAAGAPSGGRDACHGGRATRRARPLAAASGDRRASGRLAHAPSGGAAGAVACARAASVCVVRDCHRRGESGRAHLPRTLRDGRRARRLSASACGTKRRGSWRSLRVRRGAVDSGSASMHVQRGCQRSCWASGRQPRGVLAGARGGVGGSGVELDLRSSLGSDAQRSSGDDAPPEPPTRLRCCSGESSGQRRRRPQW